MRILAIESSCDETAAAVVIDGIELRANVVHSQAKIHARYGGVVPEVASRDHLVAVLPVIEQALEQAALTSDQLDAIAATYGPGLIGSLLVGLQVGKVLSWAWDKPLVAVNHLDAHLAAAWLTEPELSTPFVGLVVSGGHTSLYLVEARGHYRLLGATRDDAAGEAFDKVGKMLGLAYPAGPQIDRLARRGDPKAIHFPRPMLQQPNLDFSFSGLKTAVLTHVEREGLPDGEQAMADLCASAQEAVVETLLAKTERAVEQQLLDRVVVVGGVAANSRLRQRFEQRAQQRGWQLVVPPIALCTDNAAMVGAAAEYSARRGEFASLDLNASASVRLV